jgi:hypothetical protein
MVMIVTIRRVLNDVGDLGSLKCPSWYVREGNERSVMKASPGFCHLFPMFFPGMILGLMTSPSSPKTYIRRLLVD